MRAGNRTASILAGAALFAVLGCGTALATVPAGNAGSDTPACVRAVAADPFALYGDEIRFEVRRNGTPIGSHVVSFARNGEMITTRTRFEVAVEVLFITAYRYVYASEGMWRNGCLVSLSASVDENGERSEVRVRTDGARLAVSGAGGTASATPQTNPTEHWDYGVVGSDTVINTITGRLNAVEIAPAAAERVEATDGRKIDARRYAYRGELDNEVWYDADGRWVKMRFPGKDGSMIEYVCVACGLDGASSRS